MAVTMNMIREYAVIREMPSGYRRALRLISWNDMDPRLDLREWTPSGLGTKRGFTLTDEEAEALCRALGEYLNEKQDFYDQLDQEGSQTGSEI